LDPLDRGLQAGACRSLEETHRGNSAFISTAASRAAMAPSEIFHQRDTGSANVIVIKIVI